MLDIRHLSSFIMVAQCLSFTEASKRLYVDQSTLSRQIAELEKGLGVELFIRHYRSLELTPAGKTLFREGANLIHKLTEVIEKTQQAQLGMRGNIKIGCFGFEDFFLPNTIKKFRTLYPQISIDIQVLTFRMIEDALDREELDIGFTGVLGSEWNSRFEVQEIYRVPLCLLLRKDHPLAGETALDISALANETFITLLDSESEAGLNWFLNFCKKRGFSPNIISNNTRLESIIWQVEAGIGISFMAKDFALMRCLNTNIALIDLLGEDAYGTCFAMWKKQRRNPAITLFRNVLASVAQNTRD